ncbi:hypothetical protein ACOMHN_008891 [Nucella lapillus]
MRRGTMSEDATIQENIYASGCSGEEVILQCPLNHRIAIKRLFYGVKRSWDCQQIPRKDGCCQADHKDCVINDDSKYPTLNTRCSGYHGCKFMVQKIPTGSRCGSSPYTDYMTVIFDCVPEKDIAMFCSDDVRRGPTLYLSNVEYPDTVQAQKTDCMCMVRTLQATQGINIHSIDVLLAWAQHPPRSCSKGTQGINIHSIDVLLAWAQHPPRSCSKKLAIKDEMGYRWDIQCGHIGYYGFRTIYTKPVQNVTLTLTSSSPKGSAFVWLQTKATDDEDQLEIYCGEPLRQILLRAKQEAESRHRNRNSNSDRTTPPTDKGRATNSTHPYPAHSASLSSNLAAIIGGIVAAGIVLISIVIIAITIHCKRVQQAKEKSKQTPLMLYPAVTNGEATHLTSYCRYNEYDDDHYSSINRSPLKMASLTDSDIATTHARSKGFVTLATAEAHPNGHVRVGGEEEEEGGLMNHILQSPSLPRSPVSFSPPSSPLSRSPPPPPPPPPLQTPFQDSPSSPTSPVGDSLLHDPGYTGHLSLRFQRPSNGQIHNADVHDGHKTLPDNRHKILVSGPKSPLGKRSKSVTFSQPVAMVTPLPSGSEESMAGGVEEEEDEFGKGLSGYGLEDSNYDNLNKVIIPDYPLSPSQIHTLPMHPRPDQPYPPSMEGLGSISHSLPRSLSTFRAEEEERGGGGDVKDYDEVPPFTLPPPPPPIMNGDAYAVVHKKPVPLPVFHPQKQNAQLYETGV